MVVLPHRVVEVQQTSSRSLNLLPSVAIAFLNGMGIGSNLAYAGLVLPHHTSVSDISRLFKVVGRLAGGLSDYSATS